VQPGQANREARPADRVRVCQQARLGRAGDLPRLHLEPSSPQRSPQLARRLLRPGAAAGNGAAGINFEYRGFSTG